MKSFSKCFELTTGMCGMCGSLGYKKIYKSWNWKIIPRMICHKQSSYKYPRGHQANSNYINGPLRDDVWTAWVDIHWDKLIKIYLPVGDLLLNKPTLPLWEQIVILWHLFLVFTLKRLNKYFNIIMWTFHTTLSVPKLS